jgi:hypothetical protein
MSEHNLQMIETIERLLRLELKPSIHKRDEQDCLIRMQSNLSELKFLVQESILEQK